MITSIFVVLLSVSLGLCGESDKVYEMDDRIIDFTTQGKWLITFYAPWCGHCKKLEPVLDEIAKYYHGKMLTVAKVDATRFIKAANHFEVKGYPTIKFWYGKQNYNFHGERRKEDIIEFIERADAPRVQRIHHRLDFEHHKVEVPLFFVLIVRPEENHTLIDEYVSMAEKHFLDAYFFYSHPDYVAKTATIQITPRIGVVKSQDMFFYEKNDYESLEHFIKLEQFLTFTEVTLTNFYNLMDTKKTLIILLLRSEKEMSRENPTRKIKQIMKIYSKTFRNKYHKEFHFGYTENIDLLSNIAIWSLSSPVLFVLNSTSYEYTLIEVVDEKNRMIDLDYDNVLDDLRNNRLQFFGGRSFLRSIRRPLWEIYRAIIEMFIEAPIISLLIFGFPFGVISIVFYFLCCLDTNDDPQSNQNDLSDSDAEDEQQAYLEEANRLHRAILEKKGLPPPPEKPTLTKETNIKLKSSKKTQ